MVATGASALTISQAGAVVVPAGTAGDPDLTVTSTSSSVTFAGSASARDLTVNALSFVAQSGPLTTTRNASLSSVNANVTLEDPGNDFATVGGNANNGTLSIVDKNSVVLGASSTLEIDVKAPDGITQTGSLATTVGQFTTTDKPIVLNDTNNTFSTFIADSGAAATTLAGKSSLTLGTIKASDLVVNTKGQIAQAQAAKLTGNGSFTSGNNPILITNAGNRIPSFTANAGTGTVKLVDQTDVALVGASTAIDFNISANGKITQTGGSIVSTGTATFTSTANGAIVLNQPGNDFSFVTANAGTGSFAVTTSKSITLSTITASDITVKAGTSIMQVNPLTTPGTTRFTTTNGNVTLNSGTNDFGTLFVDVGTAEADIINKAALQLGDVKAGTFVLTPKAGLTAATSSTVKVTNQLHINGGAFPVTLGDGIDLSFGASSAITSSSLTLSGKLTVPAVTTGFALDVDAPAASVTVTLNLGALPAVPSAETRLHVFRWKAGSNPTVDAMPGTLPSLPTGFSFDFSELATSGDVVIRVCGDGNKAASEVCDDGNTVTETECPVGTASCKLCNATCTQEIDLTGSVCGDGVTSPGETCDDGNTTTETACPYGTASCTLCDATCQTTLNLTGNICGDGDKDPSEACDDGNTTNETTCPGGATTCKGCNADCTAEIDVNVGGMADDAGPEAGSGDDAGTGSSTSSSSSSSSSSSTGGTTEPPGTSGGTSGTNPPGASSGDAGGSSGGASAEDASADGGGGCAFIPELPASSTGVAGALGLLFALGRLRRRGRR